MSRRVMKRAASEIATARLDVLVVLNPQAASADSDATRTTIAAAMASRGLRGRIIVTSAGGDVRKSVARAVARAMDEGCRRIVAVGGDGTVGMTAAGLMKGRSRALSTALAIVPTGTANVLARELGIPLVLEDALTLALDGDRTLVLDAIQAEDRPVFTQVGIGLDAQMIRHTSRAGQSQKSRLAYVLAFARRAIGQRAQAFEIEIDDRRVRLHAWQVVVANIGVLGAPPFTWGPGIDPSDGTLDVCVFGARTAMDYVTLVRRMLTGHHRRDSQTQYFRVEKRVVISSRRPVLVQGDGEILGRTPVTLSVMKRALRVCVPKDLAGVESMPGSPSDPVPRVVPVATNGAAPHPDSTESIKEDVDTMVAQHSRTWLLQGPLRHPLTFLSALDAALYLRINALDLGPRVDRALVLLSKVMHYGEGWAGVALVMLVADYRTAMRAVSEALPVLWATMLTVNIPLKALFRRRRPFIAFVDARVVGPRPKDFSFPSGHTAAAFAGALLFGAHAPLWWPLFYALAVVIGFSRVYLGVHYLSDVLIGAFAGTVLAGAYLALLRWVVALWT